MSFLGAALTTGALVLYPAYVDGTGVQETERLEEANSPKDGDSRATLLQKYTNVLDNNWYMTTWKKSSIIAVAVAFLLNRLLGFPFWITVIVAFVTAYGVQNFLVAHAQDPQRAASRAIVRKLRENYGILQRSDA